MATPTVEDSRVTPVADDSAQLAESVTKPCNPCALLLTNGERAWVSPEDYDRVSRFTWYARRARSGWYAWRKVGPAHKRASVHLHHEIKPPPPGCVVDHIDGDGLNNTRNNLRVCSQLDNLQNSRKKADTSSRYKGVTWDRQKDRWKARIRQELLGLFRSEEDAARAYDDAARRRFGEFARLNFPRDGEQPALPSPTPPLTGAAP